MSPITLKDAHARHHSGINQAIAITVTAKVGTMWAAYLFACIGIGSLVGVFTGNVFLALLFGSISSYFLQLVLLPVLAVGQSVLGKHAEMVSAATYADAEEIKARLERIEQLLAKRAK